MTAGGEQIGISGLGEELEEFVVMAGTDVM